MHERRTEEEHERPRQRRPDPAAAHGGQVAMVLGMQQGVGNAVVARAMAGPVLARSPAGQAVIDRHMDTGGLNLNEEALGLELAGMLPGGVSLANDVMWTLDSDDRDDVALAISEAVPDQAQLSTKARGAEWFFLGLVKFLQDGPTANNEAVAIERLTRAASPDHERLASEPWNSSGAVTGALTAQGASMQSQSGGMGDLILDEYSIIMDSMPPTVPPEGYLSEMSSDLNKAVNSELFDSINEFKRRPRTAGAAVTGAPAVGDIYHIDIKGPDNGSVMLVESTPDHFIFQTVTTQEDGSHPEYGSRQFGFERLENGAVRWYTKGASRPGMAPGSGTIGRHAQEAGWTRMLRGIAAELTRRGGTERAGSFKSWNTHRDDLTGSGTRPL